MAGNFWRLIQNKKGRVILQNKLQKSESGKGNRKIIRRNLFRVGNAFVAELEM